MRIFIMMLALGCLVAVAACTSSKSINQNRDKAQAHHTVDGYKNLYIEDPDKDFFDFFRMRFLGDQEWADHFALANTVKVQKSDLAALAAPPSQPQVTWLGHSMFLVQHAGLNVLSDPIFRDRASPTTFAGPKRYTEHAMDYAQLPAIDWVVISHNHYDHLDTFTLRRLAEKSLSQAQPIQFAVPLGLTNILLENNVLAGNIHELDWWQSIQANKIKIEALPSQHWSSRGLSDRLKSLWVSWSINIDDYQIWFAGDTGYNNVQFTQIGEYLGGVDLALIPIGGYEPRWFMQQYHVNPAEAIKVHQDVKSKLSIGMHWGTFPLTAEAPMAPVEELAKQRKLLNIADNAFITMDIGQTLVLPHKAH